MNSKKQFLYSFDENNDGVITREEMDHFVKDIHHLFSEEDMPNVDLKSSCIALNTDCKKARRETITCLMCLFHTIPAPEQRTIFF